jgi:TonB-dependent starch-binding outer membrane protein SusC
MKNSLLKSLLTFLTVLITGFAYSQNVSGTVSDSSGPLAGASVMVKGTTNGTSTDIDGNFTIKNVGTDAVLVFSYIGLTTQEVAVGSKSVVNVVLIDDKKELKEVVVIGYGSVKRKDATGAVESIKSENFNRGINTSPEQLLQGKSAGVQVTAGSGEPGVANTVRIRGNSSIRSGSEPLYVIDGIPVSSGNVSAGTNDVGIGSQTARNPLNFINPSDIESMEILKDASATAIYGSRGANGVIIIVTKRGKKGEGRVTFNSSLTYSKIARDYNLLNAAEFAKNTPAANNFGSNVNAFDEILRTAITKLYDFSFSGGDEKGTYRFSMSHLDQEGIIKNTGLEKYNASLNMTRSLFDGKLKLEGSITGAFVKDEAAALSDNIGAEGDLLISALKWNPTRSFYNPDGSYVFVSNNQRNPLDLLDNYTDFTETNRILGNFSANYKITKELDYKVNIGVDFSNSNRGTGLSKLLGIDSARNRNGIAAKSNITRSNYLIEHTLNYNTSLSSVLKISALAGYSFQKFENKGNTVVGSGFGSITDQNFYINNITAATSYDVSGNLRQRAFNDPSNKLQSYFGRAILTYDNKYIFSGIIRADGSSKFGANNKYGYFPALSVAWKVDQESFVPKVFSDLKLRGGWGLTGNQEFPAGAASDLVGINNTDGPNGALEILNVGNPDLKWEQTAQINVGIDFGILNNRLSGTVDLYKKTTTDALLQVATADPAGFPTKWANLSDAKIVSQGIEISLNYKIIDKENISWSFGGNIAFNSSKVENLKGFPTGIQTGTISGQGLSGAIAQGHFDGQDTYTFNLLQFQGFDNNGNSVYEDVDKNGVINEADRKFSGSANPDFNVGLNTSFRYKNWDFNASGYGAYGRKIYDNTSNALFFKGALTAGNNVPSSIVGTAEAASGNSNAVSTRFLQSGDFFRLANVELGYNFIGGSNGFPTWIRSIRVFVTGTNLFVITPYKGFDPEVNSNKQFRGIPSSGIDYASYPRARAFTFGINVNL